MRLSKILVYPIKALSGVQLNAAAITDGGSLYNDRRWAMVDEQGGLVNGKNNKKIFLLKPSFDLASETVCFLEDGGNKQKFALDDVAGLSEYFTDRLGKRVFVKEDKRQGFPDDMQASGPTVVSQASLEAVASWYPALSIDEVRARFRINLEVSSAPAFWEDQLFRQNETPKIIRIGDVEIYASNPCARCSVPTKDSESGASYSDFYEVFVRNREQTKPSWVDVACFDHWYRLSANTTIKPDQVGKLIALGDVVSIEA
ncbi:MAG: MOSC N-terminal beta barrel domain-containing protein [Cycloclasticus sp.]